MEDPLQSSAGLAIDEWNKISGAEKLAEILVNAANQGNAVALHWAKRLRTPDARSALLDDVDNLVLQINCGAFLVLDQKKQSFQWRIRFGKESLPSQETLYAFLVAWLVATDSVDCIKQCQLPREMQQLSKKYPRLKDKVANGDYECDNYFVGNPKAKWCSNRCGTRYRQTMKREIQKGRQML